MKIFFCYSFVMVFSIRTKILLLIVGALFLSGTAYVWLGTQLIIKDKTSYIYDYSAAQVGVISERLRAKLIPLNDLMRMIAKEGLSTQSPDVKRMAALIGVEILKQKPLSPSEVSSRDWIELHETSSTSLTIDFNLSGGERYSFIDHHAGLQFEQISKDLGICVMTLPLKHLIYSMERTADTKPICGQVGRAFTTDFQKGAQELKIAGRTYLLTYQTLLDNHLVVLSYIPTEVAFISARKLFYRSIVLGLSLFLLTIGLALLVVRTLTSRIQDLTLATQQIGQGDFDLNLNSATGASTDEITLLSRAFSAMSSKIKQLIADTVEKVRMEKELETAQMVQRRFLPLQSFQEDGVLLEGVSLSATECGGDFWQYTRVQDHVVFLFGDITGHGVPAALLTAAVHGVFISMTQSLHEAKPIEDPAAEMLTPLLKSLNSVIYLASKDEASFPCIACVFDLKKRVLYFSNHGHPSAFVYLKEENKWSVQRNARSSPLGQADFVPAEVTKTTVDQGLNLFFYTDGLFDPRASDNQKLNRNVFLKNLGETFSDLHARDHLAEEMMKQAKLFFGEEASARPDDITLVQMAIR